MAPTDGSFLICASMPAPATEEWSRACAFVRQIPPSSKPRMVSIAAVYAHARAAANGTWATSGVLAAMSAAARQSIAREVQGGARELAAHLSTRGVLCNASYPCRVSVLPHRLGILEVCLPNISLRARLCEPYGEPFQQEGAPLGGGTNVWCGSFDLLLLARWWITMREGRAPFLEARRIGDPSAWISSPSSSTARRLHDKRLRQLLASKSALSLAAHHAGTGVRRTFLSKPRVAAYASEFVSLFHDDPPPVLRPPLKGCRMGAFVGSGHDLRCGQPRGSAIDASDLVFRANAAHPTGGLANNWLGHSLRRFRLDARRAGRKTTHRVQCLYADQYNSREGSECILSRTWWEQPWGEESSNNAQYTCCEKKSVRSSYNLSRLQALRREHGLRPLWFAGSASGDPMVDRMRESSGGQALLAALALCQTVDVYGTGLLRLGAELGDDVVYSHFYDKRVGRCARAAMPIRPTASPNLPSGSAGTTYARSAAAAKRMPGARTWSRSKWRRARVGTEVVMHLFHAFGIVRWVQ